MILSVCQKALKNYPKMDAKRHRKSFKNRVSAAHGPFFIDFGRFSKTMKFSDFWRSTRRGNKSKKNAPKAKKGGK